MTPRIGRPKKDISRTKRVDTRLTDEEAKKLNYCCEILGMTKAEVVRIGIDKVYEEIKKDDNNLIKGGEKWQKLNWRL